MADFSNIFNYVPRSALLNSVLTKTLCELTATIVYILTLNFSFARNVRCVRDSFCFSEETAFLLIGVVQLFHARVRNCAQLSCLQCFDTVGWAAGRAFGL